MLRVHLVMLTASLLLIGCSRSTPNKAGGDGKPGSDQQTPLKPPVGATDGGPGFDIPTEKPVPAVPFAKLVELLPTVPGYQAEKATGANVEFGEHHHSHAEQIHRK